MQLRLKRPHVSFAVRRLVVDRMLEAFGCQYPPRHYSDRDYVKAALWLMFGDEPVHLDHDPPLMLRERDGDDYMPRANDPAFLVYRTKEDHRIKTYVRGDGAQLSDAGKRRKESRRQKKKLQQRKKWAKLAAKRGAARSPSRWPKRKTKWPKRKIESRSTWR